MRVRSDAVTGRHAAARALAPGPLAWAGAALVAAAALLPVAYLALRALEADGGAWRALLRPRSLELLAHTGALVGVVAPAAAALGLVLAWLTARTDLPGRRLLTVALAVPLAIPSYLIAWSLAAALGRGGMLARLLGVPLPEPYGLPGAALAVTLATYPYVYLTVRGALLRLDPAWEEASRTLGRGPLATAAAVVLPLLRPALASGTLVAALYALGDFGAVSFMQYETFTLAIYVQYRSGLDRAYGAVLSLVLVAATLLLLWADARARGLGRVHRVGPAVAREVPPVPLGRWRGPAVALCVAVVLVGVGVPVAVVAYWLAVGARHDAWRLLAEAATGTLAAGAGAAAVTVAAALPLAWVAARGGGAWARRLEAAVYAGHALPGIVVAFSLVFFAIQAARPLYQTPALLLVGYAILFLPLAAGALRAALLQVGPHVEEAARTLGATPARVWRTVTLPLLRPGMAAGASLVFLAAVKELPATLLLAPLGFRTLATAVWSATEEGFYGRAAAPALGLVLLSFASVSALLAGEGIRLPLRARPVVGEPEGSSPPPEQAGAGDGAGPRAALPPARGGAGGVPALSCRGVVKRFGATVAVDGATLEVRPGELVCLLGPSGCGKTTLLRLLAGLERLDAGSIAVGGRLVAAPGLHVPPERRGVGLVFQDYALFPHLTVFENASYGVRDPAALSRVRHLLRLAGLDEHARRWPHELSGGQQQRLALVRALAAAPEVILLDEPFSNLDYGLRRRLRREVRALLRQAGATALLVTHDQEEALSLADRVAVMWRGRIVQVGTPQEVYFYPATREVAGFLGEANFLPAVAEGGRVTCPLGTFPAPAWLRGPVEAMFRPESLEVAPDAAGDARVLEIAFFGHDQLLTVELPAGHRVLARVMGAESFAPGQRVRVRPRGGPMLFERGEPGPAAAGGAPGATRKADA